MELKKVAVKIRKTVKIAVILTVATIIILGLIQLFYKQTYSVSLNGEIIGYTNDKIALQERINNYLKGNGSEVAFVEINNLPTYKVCLLKKGIKTNDDEIFNKVTSSGISYYKYYAVTVEDQEKAYVSTFADAEEVVNQLKQKQSNNADELGIVEKYGAKDVPEEAKKENSSDEENVDEITKIAEVPEMSSIDDSVNKIYEKKVQVVNVNENTSAYKKVSKTVVNAQSYTTNLGITLIQPVTGTISSRFGYRSRDNHKGLDIAAPRGTAIKAAASGTVIFSGWGAPYSGYGNAVVVNCGNGVVIIYGHCSALYVKKGEKVVQGQVISAVGSTGISTGNHLHFEIRHNGKAVDPQNYVYK